VIEMHGWRRCRARLRLAARRAQLDQPQPERAEPVDGALLRRHRDARRHDAVRRPRHDAAARAVRRARPRRRALIKTHARSSRRTGCTAAGCANLLVRADLPQARRQALPRRADPRRRWRTTTTRPSARGACRRWPSRRCGNCSRTTRCGAISPTNTSIDRLAIDLINGSPLLREWVDDPAALPGRRATSIGSDLDKPDGLTLLNAEDLTQRIWPLPARKINGIGPKASERLAGLGIHSIGELAQAEAGFLQQHFGRSYGRWLLAAAHGIDERALSTSSEPKSISRETTFERDLHPRDDRPELSEIFTALCTRVAEDLRRKDYQGRTIGIKLRFADFQTVTRDLTLPAATDDAQAIRRAAGKCLRRVPLDRKLRLLGVRVSALSARGAAQDPPPPRQGELALSGELR
jgi:hypothetical protein